MGFHDIQIQDIANNTCALTGMYSVYGHLDTSLMRQLIKAFETNHSLTTFSFSPEEVDDLTQLSDLFEILKQHEPLQELKLATEFKLSKDNLSKLQQLITTHPTLHTLNLRKNICNTEQLKHFTDALKNCKQLKNFSCMINNIPDNVLLDTTIKLIGYDHLMAIVVYPENVTKDQMNKLVKTLRSNTHLKDLSLVASAYEAQALLPLLNYLKTNTTLTELGLGDITNIDDFKQLADTMSKNKTLRLLSCEIPPTKEFFDTAYKLVSNNNTLIHFEFFSEDHKLGTSSDLESMLDTTTDKINSKLKDNKKMLQANNTSNNKHSKKRSIEASKYDSILPQKRPCYSLDKKDENTHKNTE